MIPPEGKEFAKGASYEDWSKQNPNDYDSSGAAQKFSLIPFHEIKLDTASAYLVKGLIPRTGLTVIWGPPKCGKSFWAFDVSMHIALGWEYHGRRVKQGAVVYCALEGAEGFRARIEAFRQARMAEEATKESRAATRESVDPFGRLECERRDSNPHALRHRNLNPACLPVPPLSQVNCEKTLRRFYVALLTSSPSPLLDFGISKPVRRTLTILLTPPRHGLSQRHRMCGVPSDKRRCRPWWARREALESEIPAAALA